MADGDGRRGGFVGDRDLDRLVIEGGNCAAEGVAEVAGEAQARCVGVSAGDGGDAGGEGDGTGARSCAVAPVDERGVIGERFSAARIGEGGGGLRRGGRALDGGEGEAAGWDY